MPYCVKCGNKVSEEAVFCDKCGNKINSNNEPQISNIEIKSIQEEQPKKDKWSKVWETTKKVGKVVSDRAQIIAENMEEDRKNKRGIFAEDYIMNWEPQKNADLLKMELPKSITLDAYSDESIFGTKQKPNKRPHINKALRVLIFRRDKGVCKICDKRVDSQDYNIGHDLAHSKGGLPTKSNLFLSHPYCNRGMGTKSLKEMRQIIR